MASNPTAPNTPPIEAEAEEAAPKKGGKKKLILIAVPLVLALAGGGAWFAFSGKHGKEGAAEHKAEPKKMIFVPLEPFTVNLADDDADRYGQIGITLQVSEAKTEEEVKTLMPVVRNRILLILAGKTSRELVTREGKEQLAREIMTETGRILGWTPPKTPARPAAKPEGEAGKAEGEAAKAEGETAKAEGTPSPNAEPAAAAPEKAGPPNPVDEVHFSQFIIQ